MISSDGDLLQEPVPLSSETYMRSESASIFFSDSQRMLIVYQDESLNFTTKVSLVDGDAYQVEHLRDVEGFEFVGGD